MVPIAAIAPKGVRSSCAISLSIGLVKGFVILSMRLDWVTRSQF
jgi:hypothetical protein